MRFGVPASVWILRSPASSTCRASCCWSYVSGIMFVARHFAGPLCTSFADWLLCAPACLASLMVLALIWPILLDGIPAAIGCGGGRLLSFGPHHARHRFERFPHGGSLLMGLMGRRGLLRSASSCRKWAPFSITRDRAFAGREVRPSIAGSARNIEIASSAGLASQASFRGRRDPAGLLLVVFGVDLALRTGRRAASKAVICTTNRRSQKHSIYIRLFAVNLEFRRASTDITNGRVEFKRNTASAISARFPTASVRSFRALYRSVLLSSAGSSPSIRPPALPPATNPFSMTHRIPTQIDRAPIAAHHSLHPA